MTDEQPDTTVDPISRMPSQLQAANRRKRANGMGNPPSQVVPLSIEERLDALERENFELRTRVSTSPFVEAQPEGRPQVREAADVELSDWQRGLRQQTRPTPNDFGGDVERPYNHRQRWFMKHDGSIVQLQGSPQARAYYQDKGFRMLTEAEVKVWLQSERPKVVAIQQQKAHLITTLRRTVQLDPALKAALDPSWDGDLSLMTVQELQGQLDWVAGQPTADGRPRRVLQRLPRLQDADSRRAEAEEKRLLEGVQTNATVDQEDFLNSLERARHSGQAMSSGQGRTIEVTPANVNQFR